MIGVWRDGTLAPFLAPQGGGEDRHGGAYQMMIAIRIGQQRQAGAQALDRGQSGGGGQQIRQQVGGRLAGPAQFPADLAWGQGLGCQAVPQQRGHIGEIVGAGNLLDIPAPDDQPPGAAVHLAQHCFGRDEAVQTGVFRACGIHQHYSPAWIKLPLALYV